MPLYMYQASYSAEATKTLVNNPQDRSGAAKVAIESNGGTMMGAWMAFVQDDIVVIADMPDDESMAGVAFAVTAAGAITGGRTAKLLEMSTAVAGIAKAKTVLETYKAPS